MGLVLPGMDDAKSFTMRQDVLVAKDGQVVVQASPNHPYQYLVFADTAAHSQTLQLFNKKSFPVLMQLFPVSNHGLLVDSIILKDISTQ
mmetsp:Transcript_27989/g.23144  ORF Transcript_27989/g.23144 Transcript_27989/m.23144 type:complete len:89 (+) Transcript_27989:178-444(+)